MITFLAWLIFICNAIFISILVWFYSDQNKVKFVRISDWPGVHKFFTLPISLFCVLVLAGTFVMVTHSNNEIDQMWADAGKTRPTAEQMEPREVTKFEPRECDREPDPFGNVCKDPYIYHY